MKAKAKDREKELIGYLLELKDEKPTEYLRILKSAADEQGPYKARRAAQALPLLDAAIALAESCFPDSARLMWLYLDRMTWLSGRHRLRQCKELCAMLGRKPHLRNTFGDMNLICIETFINARCWSTARNEFTRCMPMFRKVTSLDWSFIRELAGKMRGRFSEELTSEIDALIEANTSTPAPAPQFSPAAEIPCEPVNPANAASADAIISLCQVVRRSPIPLAWNLLFSISNDEHGWALESDENKRAALKACVDIGRSCGEDEIAARALVMIAEANSAGLDPSALDVAWQAAIEASDACPTGFHAPLVRVWYARDLIKQKRHFEATKQLLAALDRQASDGAGTDCMEVVRVALDDLREVGGLEWNRMPEHWNAASLEFDAWVQEWKAFRARMHVA